MSSTYTAFKSMVANDLVRRLVAKNAQINMIFARYQTMPNERILKKVCVDFCNCYSCRSENCTTQVG